MNTGKLLEIFIEQIEKILLPHGFNISVNEKIFNDEGVQVAEFDIEIEGKIGSTHLKWLIECRDRPSKGSAPGSWIEQLVGRRDRVKFDKVIAVSTTGFAEGALSYAKEAGIEVRTVAESNFEQINDWFLLEKMTLCKRGGRLDKAILLIDKREAEEKQKFLCEILERQGVTAPILISTETKEVLNITTAFQAAVNSIDGAYDQLISQGGSQKINLRAAYPREDSHYFIETNDGNIRIKEIIFQGEILVTIEEIPIAAIKNYENISKNEQIATTANFIFESNGVPIELSFNKVAETGETHILLSKV